MWSLLRLIAAAVSAAVVAAAGSAVAGPVAMAAPAGANWPTQTIQGPASRVALVELFTSEGCSSCPPADRWLSALVQDRRLWRDVAPLAFHVDYWDQLGWRDRFASAANTQRQRSLAERDHANGVYKPGIFFDAGEWRGFFQHGSLPATPAATPGPLTITIGGDSAIVSFTAAGSPAARPSQAHLALLGFGMQTNVQRGENGGHTLHHDFVVLSWQQQPLTATPARFHLAVPPTAMGASRLAVVAWVTDADRQQPVQAAGGWLHGAATTALAAGPH